MNNPDPFARIRGQLHQAAAEVRLATGSEVATIRAAHRRRNRGRALVGVTTAVAVGGGTIVAIQQLGKTSPGAVTFGDEAGTTPDHPVAAVTNPPAIEPVPASTDLGYGSVPSMPEIDVLPAVAAASRYRWSATSVDAANAVTGYWTGRVPGVIISTAPGLASDPNGTPRQQAYYTADGVTFELLDIEIPDDLGPASRLFADGESMYRVGTSPGVAATEPNPMLVEYSPDRGATWVTIELPVDTHELDDLEFVATRYHAGLVGTDAGPVFLVQRWTELDYRAVEDAVGSPYWNPTAEGVSVTDPACVTGPTMAPAPTEPPSGPDGECAPTLLTWDALGVPEESRPHLGGGATPTSRAFRIVDGAPVELPLPDGLTNLSATDEGAFSAEVPEGGRAGYRLGADLQWRRDDVPEPVAASGAAPVASDSHRFAVVGSPDGRHALASSSGNEWIYVSLDTLLEEFARAQPTSTAVTPDGLAQALMVRTDVVAEQGGVSITSGSVTITHAGSEEPLTLTDAATGEVLTGWTEMWATPVATTPLVSSPVATFAPEAQTVDFVAADGTVLATLTDVEYNSLYAYDESPRWAIATTADGVNVAVESVAELLGVDDAEIAGVRVNSVGRQVIATVVLRSEVSPGVKEQRVLVGTPNE